MRTRLIVGIVLLVMLVLLSGCSMATVTEYYERTPVHVVSVGEGVTEAQGAEVRVNYPFRENEND